jgi:O-antigen ligase
MRNSSSNLNYFLFGCVILAPLNFYIMGTQIFYVQTLVVGVLAAFVQVGKQGSGGRIRRKSLLPDVMIYVAWIVISFGLNFIFGFGELDMQLRRVTSIAIAFLLISGFFVGRAMFQIELHAGVIVKGIIFSYLLVLLYIGFVFMGEPAHDLYVIRRIIGQRLPFVIAFVTVLAATYYFRSPERRTIHFLMVVAGLLAVLLSLTRAAYIQLFISAALLFMKDIRRYFFRTAAALILVLVIATLVARAYRETGVVKQITSRFELLLDVKAQSKEDESGSFRIEMWGFLIQKLLADPVRLAIGYGQLGPTFVAREFVPTASISVGNNAHNQYLDIVVREGIIGLFIFLFIYYKAIRLGFSRGNTTTSAGIFLLANSFGLVGVFFYGFFHETFRYPLFGFYFWIYLGFLSRIVESEHASEQIAVDSSPAETEKPRL